MNKSLINKYINNLCSPEERREIERWLIDPRNKEAVTGFLKSQWDKIDTGEEYPETLIGKERIFKSLWATINAKALKHEVAKTNSRSFLPNHWLKFAAIFLIAMLGAVSLLYESVLNDKEISSPGTSEEIVKQNPRGQKSTIILPDGSKVKLNSESIITYDRDYGKNSRKINLTGEAFFEVAENLTAPFIVITKDIATTAMGTSFNINTFYPELTKVSIATGKVKVEAIGKKMNGESDLILLAGEELVLIDDGLAKKVFDPESALAWKNGVIHFDGIEFDKTLQVLERWYDVRFNVINKPSFRPLTGTGSFDNESLDNVLKALGYSLNFEYEIENKVVTIKF